jgi:LmbE family N-acetylglucosaminyl deacetylase
MTEISLDLEIPASALAIGAHPDDVEFGAGATLAKWSASGCVVHHLVLTDGSRGSWATDEDREQLVARRQEEQRAAAKRLGATGKVVFLGRLDGELESDRDTRAEVVRCIRELRPSVVLGHDPWKRYRIHPDHRHAGWLTVDAIAAAREPLAHTAAGLDAHRADLLLLFEADEPNHAEEVSAWVTHKLDALLEHRSQHGPTMQIHDATDPDQVDGFRSRIEAKLADEGRLVGVERAELFRLTREI